MKKTLLVTTDFPPLIGGIANYYFNLVNKMPPDKVVVLMNRIKNYELRITNYGFKIYYRNFFTKFIWPRWLPLIWHTYRIAKKEKIAILWVGQVLPVGTAVYIVNKLLHLPYYISCHGNDLLQAKSRPRKFILAKKILKNAICIEANTEFTKNILINNFEISAEKIKIVYPQCSLKKEMVDEEKVEELREKYNLHGKKVLLTVARLVESKGIDQVIKALPLVWQEIPELVYLIVGDGPDKNRLTRIVNRLPQMHRWKVVFMGAVPHPELPNYYALADAFILTPRKTSTDTESFGIVYLEAMEFGLPVIAGDTGGVREIKNSPPFQEPVMSLPKEGAAPTLVGAGVVNKNFILVDSENIDKIAEKIVGLLGENQK